MQGSGAGLLRQWLTAGGRGTGRWICVAARGGGRGARAASAIPPLPSVRAPLLQQISPISPLSKRGAARSAWARGGGRATHAPSGVSAAEIVGGSGRRSAVHEHGWKFVVVGAAGLLYHRHQKKNRDALALSQGPAERPSPQGLGHSTLVPPPDFVHPFEDKPLAVRAFYVVRRVLKLVFVFAPFVAASSLLPVLSGRPDFMKWYLTLMVRTLEDAGASFQKLGQWLSMRPDLFDQSVIEALSSLRDDGPRHPFSHTRELLESAFGCPLGVVFEHLEVEPVASGSVAQVHRGRLRESFVQECIANRNLDHDMSFRDVAVKVLHPGVVESAWIDGDLIFGVVRLLAKATGMGFVMPFDKDGFIRAMHRQIDFNWEAYNLKQFHSNFSGDSDIVFPRVVAAWDSVLIESWFTGKSVAELFTTAGSGFSLSQGDPARSSPSTAPVPLVRRRSSSSMPESPMQVSQGKRKRLAAAIFDMTIKMYLRDNYIHGDLHGGNVLFSSDPRDDRVFVLDAGLTTALERDWASPFGYLLHALTLGNAQRVAEKLLMFNINSKPVDRPAFTSEIQQVPCSPSSCSHASERNTALFWLR
jgi:predicted unusual protein kinase regulating ubiquinone biosynthesis (AarF/ABC1/UbiB family)